MAVCDATVSTAIPVVLVPNTVPTSVVVLAINFGEHLVVARRYVGGLGRRACCLLVAFLLVTSCASICDVWPVVESTVVFSTIFSIPAQAMAVCYATASTAIPGVLVPNTVPTSVVVLAKDFGPHLVCSFLKCA